MQVIYKGFVMFIKPFIRVAFHSQKHYSRNVGRSCFFPACSITSQHPHVAVHPLTGAFCCFHLFNVLCFTPCDFRVPLHSGVADREGSCILVCVIVFVWLSLWRSHWMVLFLVRRLVFGSVCLLLAIFRSCVYQHEHQVS